jgi:hypothetical protein
MVEVCSGGSHDRYFGPPAWCGDGAVVEVQAFYMTGGVDGEKGLIRDGAGGSPGDGPGPVRSMEIVIEPVSLL